MKNKFLILFILFIANIMAQDSYTVSWNNSSDTYSWDVYVEIRTLSYGFTLKDGMEYKPSFNSFFVANVKKKGNNNPRVKYTIDINRKNVYVKVGVIAKKMKIKSQLGTSKIIKIKSKPNT